MSNSGSLGVEIVRSGKVYLRFWKNGKQTPAVFVCDEKGPGKLDKAAFEIQRMKIAANLGLVPGEMGEATKQGITFKDAGEDWLKKSVSRKRNPIASATARGYRSYLNKLYGMIGAMPLAQVSNKAAKDVNELLAAEKLAPKTIGEILSVLTYVVSSILDIDGAQVYPVKWNWDFIDRPLIGKQDQPSFTPEQVTAVIAGAKDRYQVLYALLAGTGLRIGEALAIELGPQNDNATTISSDCKMIYVRRSVLGTKKQKPKTAAAVRDVDVCSELAHFIKEFIDKRTSGFLFNSDGDLPLLQGNILRDSLHKIAKGYTLSNSKGKVIADVKGVIGKAIGFHAFRRYRETYLELERVPVNLCDSQLGHKGKNVAAISYFKPQHSLKRIAILESAGLGFELPKASKVIEIKSAVEKAA